MNRKTNLINFQEQVYLIVKELKMRKMSTVIGGTIGVPFRIQSNF